MKVNVKIKSGNEHKHDTRRENKAHSKFRKLRRNRRDTWQALPA